MSAAHVLAAARVDQLVAANLVAMAQFSITGTVTANDGLDVGILELAPEAFPSSTACDGFVSLISGSAVWHLGGAVQPEDTRPKVCAIETSVFPNPWEADRQDNPHR